MEDRKPMLDYSPPDPKGHWGWGSAILVSTCAAVGVGFLVWSPWPPYIVLRIYLLLGVFVAVGIPLGIKRGSQEKFWT